MLGGGRGGGRDDGRRGGSGRGSVGEDGHFLSKGLEFSFELPSPDLDVVGSTVPGGNGEDEEEEGAGPEGGVAEDEDGREEADDGVD